MNWGVRCKDREALLQFLRQVAEALAERLAAAGVLAVHAAPAAHSSRRQRK